MLAELKSAVERGDSTKSVELANKAIKAGIDPLEVLKAISDGIITMGEKYTRSEVFLPEITVAVEAFKEALTVVEHALRGKPLPKIGKVVIGSGPGDVHEVGKDLVKIMLLSSGFEVYDLGRNVPVEEFINKAIEVNADIIAVSALWTPSVFGIQQLVKSLKEKGINRFKILIGGGATSPLLAKKLGVNYAENMYDAIKVAKALIKKG